MTKMAALTSLYSISFKHQSYAAASTSAFASTVYTGIYSGSVLVQYCRIKPLPGTPSQNELSHGNTRLEAWSMKSHSSSHNVYISLH